ncbi:MAG: TolC family protein [Porphyromonadaceae bacterium]|nr:TolC family protein [Porphyromonadaceae bacterium]
MKTAQNQGMQARQAITENRAKLLPLLNGFASFDDNFEPPVSATDQSDNGIPYYITHTLQYSAGMGMQLSMPLYNQTLLTSMRLVKQASEMSVLQEEKISEDLLENTAKMYFMTQVTTEQISLIEKNIQSLTELRNQTYALGENGMALEVDLQRVDLNLSKLRTAKDNALLMLQQQYNSLKYIMDYPAEKDFSVTDANISQIQQAEANGMSNDLPELKMLRQSVRIAETQLQMTKRGYIPSLSLTGFLQWNAWTGDLKRWGSGYPDNKLWNSYGLGVSLRIPIFDGLDKRSKTRKGKLDVANAELELQDTQRDMQVEYDNALNERTSALQNYQREKEAYELAQEVYNVTSDQYTEGVTTMTAVLQDQMNVNQAMSGYLDAYLNYRLANLTILKLSGQLNNLLK